MSTYTHPFCKYTDFTGEILVPNLVSVESPVNLAQNVGNGNITDLEAFITKYEKKFLVKLLSSTGYDAFVSEMESESPSEIDKALYTMLFVDTKAVADYIYYWWMRDRSSRTAGTVEVKPNQENAAVVSANDKMCRAWNEMSHCLSDEVFDYLEENEDHFHCTANDIDFTELLSEFATINNLGV